MPKKVAQKEGRLKTKWCLSGGQSRYYLIDSFHSRDSSEKFCTTPLLYQALSSRNYIRVINSSKTNSKYQFHVYFRSLLFSNELPDMSRIER